MDGILQREPKIVVTTTIPRGMYDKAKKNGWKWSECMKRGIVAMQQDESMPVQLLEAKARIEKQGRAMSMMQQQIYALNQLIEESGNNGKN